MGCGQGDCIIYLDPARRMPGREQSDVPGRAPPDKLGLPGRGERPGLCVGGAQPGARRRFHLDLGRPFRELADLFLPPTAPQPSSRPSQDPAGPWSLLPPALGSRRGINIPAQVLLRGLLPTFPPLPQPRQGKSFWGGEMITGNVFAGSLLTS